MQLHSQFLGLQLIQLKKEKKKVHLLIFYMDNVEGTDRAPFDRQCSCRTERLCD